MSRWGCFSLWEAYWNVSECWNKTFSWKPCLNSLFPYHGPKEAESRLDVVVSLDILHSEDKWHIQAFMTAYVETDSPNQVIVKSLKLGLQLLILPNSRLPNIMEYSL